MNTISTIRTNEKPEGLGGIVKNMRGMLLGAMGFLAVSAAQEAEAGPATLENSHYMVNGDLRSQQKWRCNHGSKQAVYAKEFISDPGNWHAVDEYGKSSELFYKNPKVPVEKLCDSATAAPKPENVKHDPSGLTAEEMEKLDEIYVLAMQAREESRRWFFNDLLDAKDVECAESPWEAAKTFFTLAFPHEQQKWAKKCFKNEDPDIYRKIYLMGDKLKLNLMKGYFKSEDKYWTRHGVYIYADSEMNEVYVFDNESDGEIDEAVRLRSLNKVSKLKISNGETVIPK